MLVRPEAATELTQITAALSLIDAPNVGDWRLLELTHLADAPLPGELRVLIPIESIEHQYGTPPETARRFVKWYVLLRRSEDSALDRLEQEKQRYIGELGEARSQKTEAEFARNRAEAELREKAKEIELLTRDKNSLASKVIAEREKYQAMEQDIAKLRQAIGDLRMKEILEGAS